MIRVAINGYGRIGRLVHRLILEKFGSQMEVVAINATSSTDIKGWMYLLKYDTDYGILHNTLRFEEAVPNAVPVDKENPHFKDFLSAGHLIIDGEKVPVFSQKDPALLPWKDLRVDLVLEATGKFRTKEKLKLHLDAGAKAVILSAPAKKEGEEEVPTYVMGVNEKSYQGEEIISNASCTTNCVAPVAKIMHNHFGIEKAMMTTVHAYTSDQRLLDGGHKDYRRARAAASNIVPTSTGATHAAAKALPELDNFRGLAIRVPVTVGSLSDFTFLLKKNTDKDEVNEVFKKEAGSEAYRGIVAVTEDPLVSSDIKGNTYSAVVDLSLTQVVGGNMVKVVAWYDNEMGYAHRLLEEALMVGSKIGSYEDSR